MHQWSKWRQSESSCWRLESLGLEFLVAADVIRTVALELTPRNIGMLGGLVLIQTFLSWSVVVENEGT